MPTSGAALTGVAISATLHCLTGCAIGEIAGMAIGTALGLSNLATIFLAIALAFVFGYGLTSLPLLRAGLALGAVIPIALASDTLSIATMEVVDNLDPGHHPGRDARRPRRPAVLGEPRVRPGGGRRRGRPRQPLADRSGEGTRRGARDRHPGGPSPRLVGIVAAVAFVFGSAVLVAEAVDDGEESHGGGHEAMGGHGGGATDPVRGLFPTSDGMTLQLATGHLQPGEPETLRFQILGPDGTPVGGYQVEHEKRMHLILARSDLTGFQHLHPKLGADGSWSTPVTVDEPGSYRVFADFKRDGTNQTLAGDLTVDGTAGLKALPPPTTTATADGGYRVSLAGRGSQAGRDTALAFTITRGGRTVKTEPYLGAGGHLVALREGDLAFLHVHPVGGSDGQAVRFETDFPTPDRYRLFLQFKDGGAVHTAAFTRNVAR